VRAGVGAGTDRQSLALEGELWLCERAPDELKTFYEPSVAFVDRNPKSAKLERTESRPDTDGRPSFAEVINPSDLLGEPQWMVQRDDGDAVANTDALRPLRDAGRVNGRNADRAETGEVVLSYPDAVEAVLLREVDFPQSLLDELAVGRGASAGQELKDADVHRAFAFSFCGEVLHSGTRLDRDGAQRKYGEGDTLQVKGGRLQVLRFVTRTDSFFVQPCGYCGVC
jgi:hypothetical protein